VLRGRLGGGEPLATPKRPEKKNKHGGGCVMGMSRYGICMDMDMD
jgi:hypothetical protein